MNLDLRELLEGQVLVGDGAMGTLLGERGVGFGHPYARANLSHPEMVAGIHEEYLRAGASIIETNTFSANRYKLEIHDLEDCVRQVNVAGALLDVNTATLCGLITNELVSNCLKYAFPDGRKGLIRIELRAERQNKDPEFLLIITDNGVGMPQNAACGRNGSLGLHLVRRIAQQLGGTLDLRSDAGTQFNISFKQ